MNIERTRSCHGHLQSHRGSDLLVNRSQQVSLAGVVCLPYPRFTRWPDLYYLHRYPQQLSRTSTRLCTQRTAPGTPVPLAIHVVHLRTAWTSRGTLSKLVHPVHHEPRPSRMDLGRRIL
jgi:hypothetical protein